MDFTYMQLYNFNAVTDATVLVDWYNTSINRFFFMLLVFMCMQTITVSYLAIWFTSHYYY